MRLALALVASLMLAIPSVAERMFLGTADTNEDAGMSDCSSDAPIFKLYPNDFNGSRSFTVLFNTAGGPVHTELVYFAPWDTETAFSRHEVDWGDGAGLAPNVFDTTFNSVHVIRVGSTENSLCDYLSSACDNSIQLAYPIPAVGAVGIEFAGCDCDGVIACGEGVGNVWSGKASVLGNLGTGGS